MPEDRMSDLLPAFPNHGDLSRLPRIAVGLAVDDARWQRYWGYPPGGCHSSPFVPIHPLGISPCVPIFWVGIGGDPSSSSATSILLSTQVLRTNYRIQNASTPNLKDLHDSTPGLVGQPCNPAQKYERPQPETLGCGDYNSNIAKKRRIVKGKMKNCQTTFKNVQILTSIKMSPFSKFSFFPRSLSATPFRLRNRLR